MDDLNDDALPCPLCGRAPRVWSHEQYYLHCSDNREASIEGPLRPSLAEAVAAWNAMPVHAAMALLRAVGRIDTHGKGNGSYLLDGWWASYWLDIPVESVKHGPLAGALIALAAQLDARDA